MPTWSATMSKQDVSPLAAALAAFKVLKERIHFMETQLIQDHVDADDEVSFTIDNELQHWLHRVEGGLAVETFDTFAEVTEPNVPPKAVWSAQELAEQMLHAIATDAVYELAEELAERGYV